MSALVNWIGLFMGVLPLVVVVILYKEGKPQYHGLWIFGGLMIMIAALLFVILSGLPSIIEQLNSEGKVSNTEFQSSKENIALWAYIGPAVIAAIGANLITEYILRDKPD